MSDCTHDCSNCGESCAEREEQGIQKEKLHEGAKVKKVIAVMSGKGGVGKSLVTSLLACEMQRRGFNTAILDADMTGPLASMKTPSARRISSCPAERKTAPRSCP